jgi:radical SAM protein with 4Fe4S-binding SPASM domain
MHCYSDSTAQEYRGELSLSECEAVLDDLAGFGVPGVLLSGGEPTIHPHFFEIAEAAVTKGLRITVSTNGTRITESAAARLKKLGVAYVGISLDGIGACHDAFRGKSGAFDLAVKAFRNCRAVDQKAGLRLTLTPHTANELPEILEFIEREDIRRVCFYHLVPSGRGSDLGCLPRQTTRECLRRIAHAVRRWHATGNSREVLTVDQPADGAFFWMMAQEEFPWRADEIKRLIQWNGGGSHGSGVGIGNIDSQGEVHPDQFWQFHSLGNVRSQPFSKIWSDSRDDLLLGLRNRVPRLNGRCSKCRFVGVCGGGFRVRALQRHGDPWADDPGCYLAADEISGDFS